MASVEFVPHATCGVLAQEAEFKQRGAEVLSSKVSPFACVGSTMGWETFKLVQGLWTSQLEVSNKSEDKDWQIMVGGVGGRV